MIAWKILNAVIEIPVSSKFDRFATELAENVTFQELSKAMEKGEAQAGITSSMPAFWANLHGTRAS
jgi:hypothetical protein